MKPESAPAANFITAALEERLQRVDSRYLHIDIHSESRVAGRDKILSGSASTSQSE